MKNTLIVVAVLIVGVLAGVFMFNGSNKEVSSAGQYLNNVVPADYLSMRPEISSLPIQGISEDEKIGLLYMREEEKLARDVYITLYDKWGIQIFSNISQSEQTHTEAVRALLVKYSIPDPVVDDTVGVFVNQNLKNLYNDLTKKGLLSREDALTVGATIEDLDISDLEKYISKTDNADIKLVYDNLTRGSRNHLRAFVSQLKTLGITYQPKYITEDEYKQIISSGVEMGSMMNGGMMRGRGWGYRSF
ncbi:MAG: hypothetical protein AB201_01995 [Parcubacteria bacterium C7867-006]|nr:MAG: hypothetical protein AB201_01995 [Parcubacteria bacterium C7867-006]